MRKKGKTPKAKRPIDLLFFHVPPLNEPSDLPSGEVDSEPNTPTTICPAYEVFSPGSSAYLVKSPKGQIPVSRIETDKLPESSALLSVSSRANKEEIRRSISPTGGRDFTGKIRTLGARVRSSESVYPASRVTRANNVRDTRTASADRADVEQPPSLAPKLRGRDGKFMKKPKPKDPNGC